MVEIKSGINYFESEKSNDNFASDKKSRCLTHLKIIKRWTQIQLSHKPTENIIQMCSVISLTR